MPVASAVAVRHRMIPFNQTMSTINHRGCLDSRRIPASVAAFTLRQTLHPLLSPHQLTLQWDKFPTTDHPVTGEVLRGHLQQILRHPILILEAILGTFLPMVRFRVSTPQNLGTQLLVIMAVIPWMNQTNKDCQTTTWQQGFWLRVI